MLQMGRQDRRKPFAFCVMSAMLPTLRIDSEPSLAKHFTPYQVHWILAEDPLHAQGKQVYALAEKSIRIGWTFCDGFKNVRKRLPSAPAEHELELDPACLV